MSASQKLDNRSYIFYLPTRLIHGIGSACQAGQEVNRLGAKKALIVTDRGIVKAGLLKSITDSLEKAGVKYDTFSDVVPDPPTTIVEDNYQIISQGNFDVLIAIGGGSSIDVAKGMRVLNQLGGKLRDYAGISGKLPSRFVLPLIALTTTSGTGSQISWGAVFTDVERGTKFPVVSHGCFPDVAINDASLTVSASPRVTAYTGMDALTHAVESYVSVSAEKMTDPMNLESIKLCGYALPKAVANGDNLEARENMLLAATMTAMVFNVTMLGLAHALAMPICALYNLPHGMVVGMLLPWVVEFNTMANPEKFSKVAEALGENIAGLTTSEAAQKASDAIRKLSKSIEIPQTLREAGVKDEHFDNIARLTLESAQYPYNPRRATKEELISLLEAALK